MKTLLLFVTGLLISSISISQQLSEGFETYPATGWTESHTGNDELNQTTNQAHLGAHSVLFNFGNNIGVDTSKLISPVITSLNPGSELRFWEFQQAGTFYQYHGVWISVNGGTPFEISNLGVGTDGTWVEKIIDLSAYAGDNIQLSFVYKGIPNGLHDAWYLDDVSVDALLTCPPPTNVDTIGSPSTTSVNLTWVNGANDSSWVIEYGPTGFSQGTGTMVNAGSNPFLLTGLTPATEYDIYVHSLCSLYDTSVFVDADITITTLCPNETLPYVQDFTTYQPTCWTGDKGTLANPTSFLLLPNSLWMGDDYLNNPSNGQAASLHIFGNVPGEWLFSPPIDMGFGSINNVVEFDLGLKNHNTQDSGYFDNDDYLACVISTDGGNTWNQSDVLQDWDMNNSPNVNGERIKISLSGIVGVIKIGFYGSSTNATRSSDVFIDNFRVGLDNTTGIKHNLVEESFFLFPNPTNSVINLRRNSAANANVIISDASGRLITSFNSTNNLNQIDVSNYDNGLYFITINTDSYTNTKSFIVSQ